MRAVRTFVEEEEEGIGFGSARVFYMDEHFVYITNKRAIPGSLRAPHRVGTKLFGNT